MICFFVFFVSSQYVFISIVLGSSLPTLLCPHALADVAADSIHLAIFMQRVGKAGVLCGEAGQGDERFHF